MRVLVTWGSKRGGTEGIARIVSEALSERGFEVVCEPAEKARLDGCEAVVVGGALYANRWPANVRHFVSRHVAQLRRVPVWFFSSGPLDDSAERGDIPATTEVGTLAELVGAKAHLTFGGRLTSDAKGFPASAMAKKHAGDYRDTDSIRAWAAKLADELPGAAPGRALDHPGRSWGRWIVHGCVGWALCASSMFVFQRSFGMGAALVLHALAAPLLFVLVARHYFRARGAREPLLTAVLWTAGVMVLDGLLAAVVLRSPAMFASFVGTWLPFGLIFAATWATGGMLASLPSPKSKTIGVDPRRSEIESSTRGESRA